MTVSAMDTTSGEKPLLDAAEGSVGVSPEEAVSSQNAPAQTDDGEDWPVEADDDPLTWGFDRLSAWVGNAQYIIPPHQPFHQKVRVTSCAMREAIGVITAEVLANRRPTTRDHTAEAKAKIASNVELLVANLVVAAAINPVLSVALPSKAAWFSDATMVRNPILSRRATIDGARAGLIALGLAEITRQGALGGSYTLVRATAALTDRLPVRGPASASCFVLEAYPDLVILRAKKTRAKAQKGGQVAWNRPEAVRFLETPETAGMRQRIAIINAANRPGRVTMPDMSPQDAEALLDKLSDAAFHRGGAAPSAGGIDAWLGQTQLHRIFSNSDFGQGGRFYGANWQLIPDRVLGLRRYVRIDGEPTVELDFKSCAARMAYHVLARVEAPADPYLLLPVPRTVAKTALNAMLNMGGSLKRPYRGYDEEAGGMPWPALVEATRSALKPVAAFLGTGVGLVLQRRDSDIAEEVMLHFAQRDIPCLGIHDSFLVASRYAGELRDVMLAAYRRQIGFEAIVTGDDASDPSRFP